MKKNILILLTFLMLSVLTAEDLTKDRFYYGDYALVQNSKNGGGLCFGIPIYQKNSFFIKDELNLNLYFSNLPFSEGKYLSLGNKIQFGSLKENNGFGFRTYGYMKTEFGITKDGTYKFFEAPMILELGGAGGFEFLFTSHQGFFVEFGGGAVMHSWGSINKDDVAKGCFSGSYVCLTTGFKHYIK